ITHDKVMGYGGIHGYSRLRAAIGSKITDANVESKQLLQVGDPDTAPKRGYLVDISEGVLTPKAKVIADTEQGSRIQALDDFLMEPFNRAIAERFPEQTYVHVKKSEFMGKEYVDLSLRVNVSNASKKNATVKEMKKLWREFERDNDINAVTKFDGSKVGG